MREPDKAGVFKTRAWRISFDAHKDRPEKQTTIRAYLAHTPAVGTPWKWWNICVVSLRDVPGAPPPNLHHSEATHEFLFIPMHPRLDPPDLARVEAGGMWAADGEPWFLSPVDLAHQPQALTDEEAGQVLDKIVEVMVERGISPDSDNRRFWASSINNYVHAHLRGNGHSSTG